MLSRLLSTLLLISCTAIVYGQAQIAINQVGFYPAAVKKAIIRNNEGGPFYVTSKKGDTVFTGVLQGPYHNSYSPHATYAADFSQLQKAGTYRLHAANSSSYTFRIGNHVHDTVAKAAMKGYYFQRASMPLTAACAGQWQRAAGHPDTVVLVHPSAAGSRSQISAPGGWYDAGDYNKYIVNSGITMGTLLSLYEDFPAYCQRIRLDIPESNNRLPDLLDECLYNLRWMLCMQDPDDGGVYNKLTNPSFDGMIMPDKAVKERYVVQKGTTATLDFAAVMAQAARVYAPFKRELPGLADSCRLASLKAWKWALKHPQMAYRQDEMNKTFKPGIVTGGYGDEIMQDEFTWAAAELYVTTGDAAYLSHVRILPGNYWVLPTWSQVQALGYYTLLRKGKLKDSLQQALIVFADKLLAGSNQSAYQAVMGKQAGDFTWGSSSVAANQGIALLQAYRLTRKQAYLDGALANLDYLLGRNATGYCFLTGFGSKRVMHPHHRVSVADGITDPVPGLLSGGPNPGKQDKCTTYTSSVPDEAFTDNDCSYASNEIAINWNAPFVYLVWAIEAWGK